MIEGENLPLMNLWHKRNNLLLLIPHNKMVWLREKNRTIMGLLRSMLKDKNIPLELWGEAVSTCVYVLNQSSTKGVKGKTPYEMLNGRKPNVSHL